MPLTAVAAFNVLLSVGICNSTAPVSRLKNVQTNGAGAMTSFAPAGPTMVGDAVSSSSAFHRKVRRQLLSSE